MKVRMRMVDGVSGRNAAQNVRSGTVQGAPTLLSNNRSPSRQRPGQDGDGSGAGFSAQTLVGILAASCIVILAAFMMVHNKKRRLGHHSHGARWPGDNPSGDNGGGGGGGGAGGGSRHGRPLHQTSIPIDHSKLDAFGFHAVHYAVVKGDLQGLSAIVQQAVGAVSGMFMPQQPQQQQPQRSASLLPSLSPAARTPFARSL